MPSLVQDLRYGARMLAKRPGLTALAVATLALGIGANGALFSVVHGVLLEPLPFEDPERLALVHTRWTDFPKGSISIAEYFDVIDQSRSFEDLGLWRHGSLNLTAGDGDPERVVGVQVTPSVLTTLSAEALHGRTLVPEEGEKGNDPAILLGHGLWQRRFGGREDVLGTRLDVDGKSYLVAGVMPPGFTFPNPATEAWIALQLDRGDMGPRGNHSYRIVARMKPGVTPAAAQADLDALAARLENEYPESYPEGNGFGFLLRPLKEEIVGDVRGALVMLLAAVGFVLLIACANVANLMLARATARHQEMATRTALGASRASLVRQLLVESLVLSVLGGAAAVWITGLCLQALRALEPSNLPRLEEITIDGTVLAFTLGLTLVTGLLAGLAPAIQASGRELATALREGGRGGDGAARHGLRRLLVVAEVALATVLLIGAGLLIRSFVRLQQVDPGFDPANVATASLAPSPARYEAMDGVYDFYDELLRRLEAQPGVTRAGAITNPPLSGWNNDYAVSAEGYETPNGSPAFEEVRHVTPGYFDTLRIPLLRGRDFTAADRGGDAPPVAILSRALARKFWGDEDPIGKRLKAGGLASEQPWIEVVGVVGDVRHEGLHTDWKRTWYLPMRQGGWRGMTVMARGEGIDAGLVRRQVHEMDRLQPVFRVVTMEEQVAESMAQPRFNLLLLGAFAALAMALAAVGVYGVISYSVSRRTREIGVRMALGARGADVVGHVIGHGMGPVALGLGVGIAGALALTRFLESFVFGVGTRDPATFAVYALFLAAVALLACLVPAFRATRVDPTVALRYE